MIQNRDPFFFPALYYLLFAGMHHSPLLWIFFFSAFLDYYDLPYKIIEVNPISKKELKWSDYKKVPIVLVDGEQMVNSSGTYYHQYIYSYYAVTMRSKVFNFLTQVIASYISTVGKIN